VVLLLLLEGPPLEAFRRDEGAKETASFGEGKDEGAKANCHPRVPLRLKLDRRRWSCLSQNGY